MSTPELLNPTSICPETWKAILWREWQRTRRVASQIIFAFVLLFFLMPFDPNGIILLFLCLVAGQMLAVSYGGGDIAEGSERYAFILPPRRADYFWSRYLFGLTIVSTLTAVAYLLNSFDLQRYFWGLFCETGLADPRQEAYTQSPFGKSIFCALFAYSNTYCFAASARRVGALVGSWFAGLFVAFAVPAILFWLVSIIKQSRQVENLESVSFVLLSGAISGIVLAYISRAYIGKNSCAEPSTKSSSIGKILLFIFIAYVVLGFILSA